MRERRQSRADVNSTDTLSASKSAVRPVGRGPEPGRRPTLPQYLRTDFKAFYMGLYFG